MWRSEKYLDHVRSQPCCSCHRPGRSQAHHFAGSKGTAIKADDCYTVPLCPECHELAHRGRAQPHHWRVCAVLLARWAQREGLD